MAAHRRASHSTQPLRLRAVPGLRLAMAVLMLAGAFLAAGCGGDESDSSSSPTEQGERRDSGEDDGVADDDGPRGSSGSGSAPLRDTPAGGDPADAGLPQRTSPDDPPDDDPGATGVGPPPPPPLPPPPEDPPVSDRPEE